MENGGEMLSRNRFEIPWSSLAIHQHDTAIVSSLALVNCPHYKCGINNHLFCFNTFKRKYSSILVHFQCKIISLQHVLDSTRLGVLDEPYTKIKVSRCAQLQNKILEALTWATTECESRCEVRFVPCHTCWKFCNGPSYHVYSHIKLPIFQNHGVLSLGSAKYANHDQVVQAISHYEKKIQMYEIITLASLLKTWVESHVHCKTSWLLSETSLW